MWDAMRDARADDGFADDLVRVNSSDAIMENPLDVKLFGSVSPL